MKKIVYATNLIMWKYSSYIFLHNIMMNDYGHSKNKK